MPITVQTVPAKMAILSKIVRFRVNPSSWPWSFAWPHTLTRALVWSFIQPAVFTSLNLHVRTWTLIHLSTYKPRNNVYVTARYATQPVSKPAGRFWNRPAGFEMGRPDSQLLKNNGRLRNRPIWLASFETGRPSWPASKPADLAGQLRKRPT